jgi:hypothetical protein
MHKRFVGLLFVSFLAVLVIYPSTSFARLYFLDQQIEINGSIEEKFNFKYGLKDWEKGRGKHNPNGIYSDGGKVENPAMVKTHLHVEALYHVYKDENTIFDFYTLLEWFYDASPDMNPAWRRGMHARDRSQYQTPHDLEILREAYVNYVSGPWTLRAGKQMVVWGETGLQRTADVVNPLDTRSHMMGVDDWEDFKKGLWMFRGFYQTSFKNDFTFEWIWVPADLKFMDLPPEGTMYNTTYTGGFTSQFWKRWRDDEPHAGGLSDSQGGIRLRGFNKDWDWTLIYYNGFDPSPTVIDWGQRKDTYKPRTPIGYGLYAQGIGGFNLWAAEYNINASLPGNPSPGYPSNEMFRFYRTNNIGATATKYVYNVPVFGLFEFPLKSNVRFEFAYKPGQHLNRLEYVQGNWLVENVTQRDIIGYAFEIGKDFMPGFITRYNGERSVDITFGLFQDWILNHDRNLSVDGLNRGSGDANSTSFSIDLTTDWFKQEVMTKFNYSSNVTGYGAFWAYFLYAPGQHWRFLLLPRVTWSNAGPWNHKSGPKGKGYTVGSDTNNYVHFKIGYLF